MCLCLVSSTSFHVLRGQICGGAFEERSLCKVTKRRVAELGQLCSCALLQNMISDKNLRAVL